MSWTKNNKKEYPLPRARGRRVPGGMVILTMDHQDLQFCPSIASNMRDERAGLEEGVSEFGRCRLREAEEDDGTATLFLEMSFRKIMFFWNLYLFWVGVFAGFCFENFHLPLKSFRMMEKSVVFTQRFEFKKVYSIGILKYFNSFNKFRHIQSWI